MRYITFQKIILYQFHIFVLNRKNYLWISAIYLLFYYFVESVLNAQYDAVYSFCWALHLLLSRAFPVRLRDYSDCRSIRAWSIQDSLSPPSGGDRSGWGDGTAEAQERRTADRRRHWPPRPVRLRQAPNPQDHQRTPAGSCFSPCSEIFLGILPPSSVLGYL